MSDKKADPAKPEGEGAKAAGNDAQGGGGFKAWLPLILSLVLMPILAAGTTRFLILPKVVQARGSTHGEAADAKGESRAAKESKGIRARPQVPVSNAPLPAHVPNAPTEKQQVPIEYRGIIR